MFKGLEWDVSVTSTTDQDDDGFPRVQLDGYGRGGSKHFELQHQFGFYSRPRDPEVDNDGIPIQGSGCAMFVAKDGEDWYGFLGIDPRYLQQIPLVEPGGAAMYAVVQDDDGETRAPFAQFDGDDGTLTIYVPLKGERAHVIQVGYDGNGKESLTIAHSSGAAIMMMDGTCTMKNAAGDAFVSCGPDGVVLGGNTTIAGGFACGGGGAQSLLTETGVRIIAEAILAWISAGAAPSDAAAKPLKLAFELAFATGLTKTTKGI